MVKRIVKKNPGVAPTVHFMAALIHKVKMISLEWWFSIKGPSQLYRIQEIFENKNVKFFVDMGTLLGIYRDGRLIKRDMDIDMAIYLTEHEDIISFQKYMISVGCVHSLSFEADNIGIFQDTFYWKNIRVDVCYYRNEGEKDVCYLMYDDDRIVKLVSSAVNATKLISFGKRKINAPEHTEQYLEERYGKGWRIPDKNYVYWMGPSAIPMDERGICRKL